MKLYYGTLRIKGRTQNYGSIWTEQAIWKLKIFRSINQSIFHRMVNVRKRVNYTGKVRSGETFAGNTAEVEKIAKFFEEV